MEVTQPDKGTKKLYSADKNHVENEPQKKLIARKKIDKLGKKKDPLPKVRSQSVSPTPVAGISRMKMPRKMVKVGNKTDKDAIPKEKTAKSKDTGMVKPTKNTGTAGNKTSNQVIKKKRNSLPRVRSQSVSPSSVAGISRMRMPKKVQKVGNKTDAIPKETTSKSKDTGMVKPTKNTGTAEKTQNGIVKKAKTTGTTKTAKDTVTVENKIHTSEITHKKPTVMEDVYEAIATNGQPRKGATSQAIKNYIFSKRGVGEDDVGVKRLNTLVNNALRKGMEDGSLQRPTTSKGNGSTVSALGRFTLTNKVVKPKNSKKN